MKPDMLKKYFDEIQKKFPEWPEDQQMAAAMIMYTEIDYLLMMGEVKPGGMLEKVGFKPDINPAGIIDFDILKGMQ